MRVDELLPALLRSDPARPRITCYDDRSGERIELSAKVIGNWVAKAANLLQEEYDAAPGTVVRLDLPPHWRTVYWALACWAVGATIAVDGDDHDVLVTTDPGADGEAVVLVTLAALARSAPAPAAAAVLDEAKELATFPDVFAPWARAGDETPALLAGGESLAYNRLWDDPADADTPRPRRHTDGTELAAFLRLLCRTYAEDGSVVLSIAADPALLPARLASEGATSV